MNLTKISDACYVRNPSQIFCARIVRNIIETQTDGDTITQDVYNIELEFDKKHIDDCSGTILRVGENMTAADVLYEELSQIGNKLGFQQVSPWLWIRNFITIEFCSIEDVQGMYPIIVGLSNGAREWIGCYCDYQIAVEALNELKFS